MVKVCCISCSLNWIFGSFVVSVSFNCTVIDLNYNKYIHYFCDLVLESRNESYLKYVKIKKILKFKNVWMHFLIIKLFRIEIFLFDNFEYDCVELNVQNIFFTCAINSDNTMRFRTNDKIKIIKELWLTFRCEINIDNIVKTLTDRVQRRAGTS